MKKPWYWKARKAWYVKRGQSQIYLSTDEREAHQIWLTMQAPTIGDPNASFASLADLYLRHHGPQLSQSHQDRSRYYLQSFVAAITCPASQIRPHDVTTWLAAHPGWGPWSQRAAIATVKRVLAWAVDEGLLDRSPVKSIKRPPAKRRETVITDAEHRAICLATDGPLRAYLIALWHSGARPGTIAAVTAGDVSPDGSTWAIREHKTAAKTGRPLTVYLSPCLATLTKILTHGGRGGNLFVNSHRRPWVRHAITLRFRRLRAAGLIRPGVTAYSYRHAFVTRALLSGTDPATVAELVGHSDLTMIARHYGHVYQANRHLREAAAKINVRKPDQPGPERPKG